MYRITYYYGLIKVLSLPDSPQVEVLTRNDWWKAGIVKVLVRFKNQITEVDPTSEDKIGYQSRDLGRPPVG